MPESSSKQPQKEGVPRPLVVMTGDPAILPLAKPLAERFDLVVVEPLAAKALAQGGLPVANLGPAIEKAKSQAANLAAQYSAKVVAALERGELPRRFSEELRPLNADAFNERLPSWFSGWAHDRMARVLLRAVTLDRIAEGRKVAAVILHNDVEEHTKAVALWAKARGVPSIHVPHAVYHDLWRGKAGEDVHDVCTCDVVLAIGPFQKRWYKKRGAKDIRLVGCPKWDVWARPPDRAWARAVLHLNKSQPVVVYASSWHQDTAIAGQAKWLEEAYRAFLEASKSFPDWQFVVKVHPHGPVDEKPHFEIAKQMGARCLVTRPHLEICLYAADLVVTFGPSNLLLEAALLGVPGISLQGPEPRGGFEEDNAVITCGWVGQEIEQAMRQALSEEGRGLWAVRRKGFLEKYVYKPDGKATERAVAEMMKICGKAGISK